MATNLVGLGGKIRYSVTDLIRLEGSFYYYSPNSCNVAMLEYRLRCARW